MATLDTMYPAQSNTPENSIVSDISETDTQITVLNGSLLPAAPNILVLGADTTTSETVLMTSKRGNIITVERGYDNTTPLPWIGGTLIGRFFCAADQDAMQNNIKKLNSEIETKAAVSVTVPVIIPFNGWIDGENEIPVNGITADTNGVIGCSSEITDAQLVSAKIAELSVSGQRDGYIKIKASGTIPDVDIPAVITIFG